MDDMFVDDAVIRMLDKDQVEPAAQFGQCGGPLREPLPYLLAHSMRGRPGGCRIGIVGSVGSLLLRRCP